MSETLETSPSGSSDVETTRKHRRNRKVAAALPSHGSGDCNAVTDRIFDVLWKRAGRREIPSGTGNVVYFIGAETGAVKIGRSGDLASRFASLRTSSPVDLRLLFFVKGDARLERCLHLTLHRERRPGSEWFRMSPLTCRTLEFCLARTELGSAEMLEATRSWHLEQQPKHWVERPDWFDDDGRPLHEKARRWALNPKNRAIAPSWVREEIARAAANVAQSRAAKQSRPGPGVGSLPDASRPISCAVPSPTEAR